MIAQLLPGHHYIMLVPSEAGDAKHLQQFTELVGRSAKCILMPVAMPGVMSVQFIEVASLGVEDELVPKPTKLITRN